EGAKMVARATPGRSWSSDDRPRGETPEPGPRSNARAAERAAPAPTNSPPGDEAPDCTTIGRTGNTNAALECYERQSQRGGMSGELALYEIARLRKDVLSDYAGALDALESYDERFPNGSLRGEVQVSRVELLGKMGRSDEALSESARLLETP